MSSIKNLSAREGEQPPRNKREKDSGALYTVESQMIESCATPFELLGW